jgi:hypothetical protein
MALTPRSLVIDARLRGPRGALAGERLLGRSVLDHLLDTALAAAAASAPVSIHAHQEDHMVLHSTIAGRAEGRFEVVVGAPPEGAMVLRTDRLYDARKLRRAVRRGEDAESAVIWWLDTPEGLDGAEEELERRRTYQPLGRFWAMEPARRIARALAPTRVRPNMVTIASASFFLAATALVALAAPTWPTNALAASALALALVLDTADGHLARLQGTTSEFGRWLDVWLDECCDMALHAAIAWSVYTRTGSPSWLLIGMIYAIGKYVFFVGASDWRGGGSTTTSDRVVSDLSPGTSFLRHIVHLAGHADIRWHLWIVLAAVGRLDLALLGYAAYFPGRAVLGAARKAVIHG